MKLKTFLKSLFYPSVDKTLQNFKAQVHQLNERIDFNVDLVNEYDAIIDDLHERKQKALLEIVAGESAVEKLLEITGEIPQVRKNT